MPQNMLFVHNIHFCTQKMQRHLNTCKKKIRYHTLQQFRNHTFQASVENMMTSLSYDATANTDIQ